MGQIIKYYDLTSYFITSTNSLIVICNNKKLKKDIGLQYHHFSLNQELAKKMNEIEVEKKALFVIDILNEMFEINENIVVSDFEMLFNPSYQLDPLKYFINLSNKRKIILEWCGDFDGENLTYATPNYLDYIAYKVDKHNITCVI
ncbi:MULTISPECIES: BREX-3 system P-loop-containing protein BrxF [unclassified Fusibacter]|uniref:BREX-3 system P-loop-containing protein BrxF n=1 Tax=unclassified Fusibacter TaxID=2624464 RepID=UPI0010117494|nr:MULTISPECIES: BREX-3 system P-loop-containing protein BrxF [unclassified Fusibacter]MCK8058413.1 BREX-3 system P-loop-containing protein BrxF [Fusibacter sp. A2]NPE22819.1 BREX-3 system P-loop-containing protein BrxF [Fusibacter sp. A1]RXV60372.1 BREX-3 system P-loop-containing protein BrxF [Fusibacter sp. A1]